MGRETKNICYDQTFYLWDPSVAPLGFIPLLFDPWVWQTAPFLKTVSLKKKKLYGAQTTVHIAVDGLEANTGT